MTTPATPHTSNRHDLEGRVAPRHINVLFSPAEQSALPPRDLGDTTCVVLDIFRATTSMVVALHHGAQAIYPVAEIEEAVAARRLEADLLLAGERNGLRIDASRTGGIEFDLGNSPREFLPEKVQGKRIVTTTTNGTRCLRACQHAKNVFIGGFVNLSATLEHLRQLKPREILLVCAGTEANAALEDALAAGAYCAGLSARIDDDGLTDAGWMARELFVHHQDRLLEATSRSQNGRRLRELPALRDDIPLCLGFDSFPVVAELQADGYVRRVDPSFPSASPNPSV